MAWTTIFLLNYRPGCPRKITPDKPREIEVLTITVKCNQIAKYRTFDVAYFRKWD